MALCKLVTFVSTRSCIEIFYQPIPPSTAPATKAIKASGTKTYFPRGTKHGPIFLFLPLLTASTAKSFPATQKNIIAAIIAPSGHI